MLTKPTIEAAFKAEKGGARYFAGRKTNIRELLTQPPDTDPTHKRAFLPVWRVT
jgi:hypothetical protein